MKRIGERILIGFIGIFASIGLFMQPLNVTSGTTKDKQSSREYATSSVLEAANTVEAVQENSSNENTEQNNNDNNNENNQVEQVQEQQETYQEPAYEEPSGNRIIINGVLDKPLMTDTTGDNFYLSHNIYGQYDGLGVPYTDFRTNFYTRKTIIYAHSSTMGNGPFQALQNYHNNQWFFENNRYITVQYEGNTYTYEIFSVYVSIAEDQNSEGLEYFYRMNYSDSDWADRIQWYKNNSEYDTGVSVDAGDRILILQTCSMDPQYYEQYYRYNLLVMGKLI